MNKFHVDLNEIVNVYMFGFGVFEYYYNNYDARNYILPLGGLIGSIIFGMITDRFGRKIPLLVIAVSMSVSMHLNGLSLLIETRNQRRKSRI